MPVMYPNGYGTQLVTIERMRELHGAKMHPEFARRLFAWIESQHGLVGIGGGWRSTQPAKPGFAPEGKSFHQSQRFRSGVLAYAAVDLVVVQPGKVHRAPTWSETANAPTYGLHTFIKSPTPEPWHMQCTEMRGYDTWVFVGRPDPVANFPLPSTPIPDPPPTARITMHPVRYRSAEYDLKAHVPHLADIGAGVPASAIGVQIRITVVNPADAGWVDAWGPDIVWSGTSSVNYKPGDVVGGTTFVGLDAAGQYWIMAHTDCHVLVDVSGWS